MKALVYHGPGQRAWESVPDPTILEPTDAIVRIDSSTICGTDLHILKGDVPEVKPGTILGHEAVGTVVEVGAAVTTVMPGDRVLVSCISSCGRCRFCKEGHYGLCTGGGGWIFGHLIDGLQAELARVPFADTSVYKVPDELSDEQVLFLADILPTAYEVGVLNGRVEPGDTVAVVGAGPIGLAAIMTAKLHTPGKIIAIDLADSRLEKAIEFGADVTINNGREDAVAKVMELTDGLGADVAIECVGVPETFELCTELIRPGGRVANVGVHGKCATLHLEKLWIRDVMITTGLVDTVDDAEAAEADRGRQARPDHVRDAPVLARRDRGGVRRVRSRGRHACAQGRPERGSASSSSSRARRRRSLASSLEQPAAEAADVVLKDGGTLRLRPPLSSDSDAMMAFFEGLSEESRFLRFHGYRSIEAGLVEPMLDPDWLERGALAGWLAGRDGDERVVAVGSYARIGEGDSAEMAFAVDDSEQGRGIGTRLLEQLASRARQAGISRFVAEVMASNAAALGVFADAGFELVREGSRARSSFDSRSSRPAHSSRASRSGTTRPSWRRFARSSRRRRSPSSVRRAAAVRSGASSSATSSTQISPARCSRSTSRASPSPACVRTPRSARSPTRSSWP